LTFKKSEWIIWYETLAAIGQFGLGNGVISAITGIAIGQLFAWQLV
jgi:hypothetical protein